MKGIIGYVFAIGIVSVLTVASFYLLGELLSKETSVSVISSTVSRTINEMEFSKFYFKKYFENEVNGLRGSGVANDKIAKKIINEVVSLELQNSKADFIVEDAYNEDSKIVIIGKINSLTDNKDFRMKAEYNAKFII